ncbi:MAG: phosphoribosyl-ATP diphosphatase [Proteobacteria bacterium]|nr:phosphoribosyl-ATP diphosphatase [Pseudomonadota bacterium]
MSDTLNRLFAIITARKSGNPEKSYTAKLLRGGREGIAKKITEEAGEAVIEVIKGDKTRLAEESADLLYHLMVAWAEAGLVPTDIWAVLENRMGESGMEEKKKRG